MKLIIINLLLTESINITSVLLLFYFIFLQNIEETSAMSDTISYVPSENESTQSTNEYNLVSSTASVKRKRKSLFSKKRKNLFSKTNEDNFVSSTTSVKKRRKSQFSKNRDFIDRASKTVNAPPTEDEYSIIMSKSYAMQLRGMTEYQRLLAIEKIEQVMFYGRMGILTENCFQ